jgi:hypothetical protein
MRTGNMAASSGGPEELRSWKQIAEYLGIEVRTAQKWEKERGLPVHRYSGGRGRVLARPSELEVWKASIVAEKRAAGSPAPSGRAIRRWHAPSIVAIALLSLTGIVWFVTRHGPPSRAKIVEDVLVVYDSSGAVLWRKQFDQPPSPLAYAEKRDVVSPGDLVRVGDIDGDGRVEVLLAEDPDLVAAPASTAVLLCLDERGEEKWRLPIDWRVKCAGGREIPPCFHIRNVVTARLGKSAKPSILVASVNMREEPGWFAVLSPDGKVRRQYWHSGHLGHAPGLLRLFDMDGDGVQEILLGGINNPRGQATLVILDADSFEGASTEDTPEYQIAGVPLEYGTTRLFFPRSCVNLLSKPFNELEAISPTRDRLGITTRELEWTREALIDYYLRMPDWTTVERAPLSAKFQAEHHRLRAEGSLDHDLTDREKDSFRAVRWIQSPGGPLPPARKGQAGANP